MRKPRLTPGPSHPITITPATDRVVVRLGGEVVADTRAALRLQEASYAPVHYVPLADVDREALRASDHATYCPFKGDASYFSVEAGGARAADALWTYEEPYEAVAPIAGHVAFYPDKVDISIEPVETGKPSDQTR
jgi:uncharacterized protein (DUF427 family)